jgi:hypothetical protein
MGVVSTIVGAASGAAVSWVKSHGLTSDASTPIGIGHPHVS